MEKWFPTLKGSTRPLLSYVTPQPGNVVVRRVKTIESKGGTGTKPLQLFSCFENAETLFKYILGRPESERDIHEIVLETQEQKPRFDIDIKYDSKTEKVAKETMSRIRAQLKWISERMFPGTDVGLREYPSSGPGKESCHVILTKLKHRGSAEAREFYLLMKSYVSAPYQRFIDPMVYGTTQNYRLLMCQKTGTDRPKLLGGEESGITQQEFEESLLGNVKGCTWVNLRGSSERR